MLGALSGPWIRFLSVGAAASLLCVAACTDGTRGPPSGGPSGQGGAGGSASTGGLGDTGGAGGIASNGGTGGVAGRGGSAGRSIPQTFSEWLADDSNWETTLGSPFNEDHCRVLAGDPSKFPAHAFEWESCGPGCEKAAVGTGVWKSAWIPRLSTSRANGEEKAFFAASSSSERFGDVGSRRVRQLFDLETGHLIAALQQAREPGASCLEKSSSIDNALSITFFGRTWDDVGMVSKGTWDSSASRWIWQNPPRPTNYLDIAHEMLEFSDGGRTFYFDHDVIYAALTPGSSEISLLDDTEEQYRGDLLNGGAEDGTSAIWAETKLEWGAVGSRIREWSAEKGLRTILSTPLTTCVVGLNRERYVGAIEEYLNGGRCSSFPEKVSLWYAPREKSEQEPTPIFSPVLAGQGYAPNKLVASGDKIALKLVRRTDVWREGVGILLTRTSDWATRWLGAIDDQRPFELTMTSKYLYVVYVGEIYKEYTELVYRYDLSKFDTLGVPFDG